MTAFPDMVVKMDHVSQDGSHAISRWTWTGTNTGPGGTGKSLRINGYEEWTMGADGLIAESKGHFDEAEYHGVLLERLQAHAAVRARYGDRSLQRRVARDGIVNFIRPDKPIENASVERFNGKFRDECSNEHWCVSLADAKALIEAWRVDDNTVRPHGSLGQLTPAAYAAAACADPKPGCGVCSAAALATSDQRPHTRTDSHYRCSG